MKLRLLLFLCFLVQILPAQENKICESNVNIRNGLSFHPNEDLILISRVNGLKDQEGRPHTSIYQLDISNPDSVVYLNTSLNSSRTDYHPVFAPDGTYVLFNSMRLKSKKATPSRKTNIWYAKYKNGKFSKPKYLKEINTDGYESYPSITKTNRIYFNSDRPGGKGMMDIYQADLIRGKWRNIKNVENLNTPMSENDLFVDPDERFMILNRYDSETKEVDLFISENKNGSWTTPKPLDHINQSGIWELTPTLSPSGQHLFIEVKGRVVCYDMDTVHR